MAEPLGSSIFTQEGIDDKTKKRLQDCADGGNETVTHIAHGARGEHVRRVQEALRRIREADPTTAIDPRTGQVVPLAVNGSYDPAFARAVFAYKSARNIRNTRKQIDDIVGKLTIQRMDQNLRSVGPVDPGEIVPPPDLPPPSPRFKSRIVHREFQQVKAELAQGEPPSVANIKDIFDLAFGAVAPETALGSEDRAARKVVMLPEGVRVNRFHIDVDLSFDVLTQGQITIVNTTLDYEWGSATPSVAVRQSGRAAIFGTVAPRTITDSTQLIPRAQAESMALVVPPDP
jgi:hypothetical protein